MNPSYLALILTSLFFIVILLPIPIILITIFTHPLSTPVVALGFIGFIFTLGITRIKYDEKNVAILAFLGPILLTLSFVLMFDIKSLFSINFLSVFTFVLIMAVLWLYTKK